MSGLPSISYTRDQLLSLRHPCACPSRTVRRRLAYFRILARHIPILVSRPHDRQPSHAQQQRYRTLIAIELTHDFRSRRHRRRRRPHRQHNPSVLLTNVRSISNKFDEVTVRITDLKPDLAAFTESWLDEETPNASISIPHYNIQRRDRIRGKGGGILCYISDFYTCVDIDSASVPSLSNVATEFLSFFHNLTVLGVFGNLSSVLERF